MLNISALGTLRPLDVNTIEIFSCAKVDGKFAVSNFLVFEICQCNNMHMTRALISWTHWHFYSNLWTATNNFFFFIFTKKTSNAVGRFADFLSIFFLLRKYCVFLGRFLMFIHSFHFVSFSIWYVQFDVFCWSNSLAQRPFLHAFVLIWFGWGEKMIYFMTWIGLMHICNDNIFSIRRVKESN